MMLYPNADRAQRRWLRRERRRALFERIVPWMPWAALALFTVGLLVY